jgi:putative tricarboxylic transport membrane protein
MFRYDRVSAIFWVGIAIPICVESIRLGPGSLSKPGPGLLPLACGLVLGILGLTLYISTSKFADERKDVFGKKGPQWGKLGFTLASLIIYAFLIELLGFIMITFLWMGFVCRLGKISWKTTVFISVIVSFLCYVLFVYGLAIRFPRGIFGI